jgi:hypothetical protein
VAQSVSKESRCQRKFYILFLVYWREFEYLSLSGVQGYTNRNNIQNAEAKQNTAKKQKTKVAPTK